VFTHSMVRVRVRFGLGYSMSVSSPLAPIRKRSFFCHSMPSSSLMSARYAMASLADRRHIGEVRCMHTRGGGRWWGDHLGGPDAARRLEADVVARALVELADGAHLEGCMHIESWDACAWGACGEGVRS
jgi:hypothetical protein